MTCQLSEKLKDLEIANNLMLSNKTDTSEESSKEFDLAQNPFYVTTTSGQSVRFSNCRKCRNRRRANSEGESTESSESSLKGVHRQKFKNHSKCILRDPVLAPIRKSFPETSCSSCRRHTPTVSGALIDSFRKCITHKRNNSIPGNNDILDTKTSFEQQQRQIANFTPKQAELRNSTSNIYDETIPLNSTSITTISQIPPEQNPAATPRSSTSCAQQAGGNVATGGVGGTCDDVTIDELASYFDTLVHIPKKMSSMAEMMYT